MRALNREYSSLSPRRLFLACFWFPSVQYFYRGRRALLSLPPYTSSLPPTPPSRGRATSKWCSASWRFRCPQLGGFRGSCRAGEGAGPRKSLRVLSQRKRSMWGRGRPPSDQGASPGGSAPALWVPQPCPQLGNPAPGWIHATPSGLLDWSWRQRQEGLLRR